jgi:hypothetical protein
MKKTIIVYGLISGIIAITLMVIPFLLSDGKIDMENSWYYGIAGMILSSVFIWIGMATYKKHAGGVIKFGRSFMSGFWIALISSTIYVLCWMVMYETIFPDFGKTYTVLATEQIQKSKKTEAKKQEAIKEVTENMVRYDKDPVYRAGMTYMEIITVQIPIVLIAAIVLSVRRKKDPMTA